MYSPMQTPNTRSKRKRLYDGSSQDDIGRLSWSHEDAGLRSEVKRAAASKPIELPAPTQKPRPISSRLLDSPSTIPISSKPASTANQRHAAMRSRRKQRSFEVPPSLGLATNTAFTLRGSAGVSSGFASGSGSGSGSGYGNNTTPGRRLDELLDQLDRAAIDEDDDGGEPSLGLGIGGSNSMMGVGGMGLRKVLQDVSGNARCDGSPRVKGGGIGGKQGVEQHKSQVEGSKTSPSKKAPCLGLRLPAQRSQHQANTNTSRQPTNSLSTAKSTSHTSIGSTTSINSNATTVRAEYTSTNPSRRPTNTTDTNTRARIKSPVNPSKPFKQPFSNTNNQPTRSSPRHKSIPSQNPPNHQNHPPPLKAQLSTSTSASEPRTPRLSDLSTETAPSSDGPSTGDESFGFMDAVFEKGGKELEDLWKAIDASQGRKAD